MPAGSGDEDERTAETPASESAVDTAEQEWRFSLDDLPDADESADSDDRPGNVAGTLETRQPLESGSIDPENAFFVLVGICLVAGLILGALLGF